MEKKTTIRRAKRQPNALEDKYWNCSVCTYRNSAEDFKCLICDLRKGTSTRKRCIKQVIVAKQAVLPGYLGASRPSRSMLVIGNSKYGPHCMRLIKDSRSFKRRGARYFPRMKNVDRSSAHTPKVTVNNITVFTEYKLKKTNITELSASVSNSSSNVESIEARI